MRRRMRKKPVRVQLAPMPSMTIRERGTSTAAAAWKAADDGSPGTCRAPSSSSSWAATVMRSPSRAIRTPAAASIRSVWSRLGLGSTTVVGPEASRPASSTHDLTCAEATGSSYSIPFSGLPVTVNGGKRPSRASIAAPMRFSGAATRSTGRRRIESSPSSVQRPPSWPASQPGSSRISVPALPTSITSAGAAARSPAPRTTSESGRRSTSAPSACTAASVEFVSAASR